MKPVKRKVHAGASAGGVSGMLAVLLAHYFDMPGEIAAAWAGFIIVAAGFIGGWLSRDESDD